MPDKAPPRQGRMEFGAATLAMPGGPPPHGVIRKKENPDHHRGGQAEQGLSGVSGNFSGYNRERQTPVCNKKYNYTDEFEMRKKIIWLFAMLSPRVNDLGNADLWVYLILAAAVVIGMVAIMYTPV